MAVLNCSNNEYVGLIKLLPEIYYFNKGREPQCQIVTVLDSNSGGGVLSPAALETQRSQSSFQYCFPLRGRKTICILKPECLQNLQWCSRAGILIFGLSTNGSLCACRQGRRFPIIPQWIGDDAPLGSLFGRVEFPLRGHRAF